MNKTKIKFLLQTANDNISNLANKFLDAEFFNCVDLSYWWNPSKEWWSNRKSAEIALKVLEQENCCIRVAGEGEAMYQKTTEFIILLNQIIRIENHLNRGRNDD
ncbi:unnamed protein product [marine sediment metagenome]|uniref:Uncharacterized protein n=1 Tax=marine sediment metagenome TaxID=412755 RepID=X0S6X2_9ZZZZ